MKNQEGVLTTVNRLLVAAALCLALIGGLQVHEAAAAADGEGGTQAGDSVSGDDGTGTTPGDDSTGETDGQEGADDSGDDGEGDAGGQEDGDDSGDDSDGDADGQEDGDDPGDGSDGDADGQEDGDDPGDGSDGDADDQDGEETDENSDQGPTPSFSNPAQAMHAASLAQAAAAQTDERLASLQDAVAQAEKDLNVALANNASEDEIRAAEENLTEAQEAYAEELSERTGVLTGEIEAMRNTGMGWGQIAHELGVHPGLLGLGHTKRVRNRETTGLAGPHNAPDADSDEIAEATERNPRSGWSKGHGVGLNTGVDSAAATQRGYGFGQAKKSPTSGIAGAAGLSGKNSGGQGGGKGAAGRDGGPGGSGAGKGLGGGQGGSNGGGKGIGGGNGGGKGKGGGKGGGKGK